MRQFFIMPMNQKHYKKMLTKRIDEIFIYELVDKY